MDRDEIIVANINLVHSCCNRFKNKGIEYEELFGAGCEGLIKAADRFDETLGFRFSTYAFPVIMGEIKRLFRDGGALKVSRSIKELGIKINSASECLANKLGRSPTVSELAEYLNKDIEDITLAMDAMTPVESLSYIDESGNVKEQQIGTDTFLEEKFTDKIVIKEAIKELEPYERKLIELRYYKDKTQSETAGLLGTTQVGVSRMEKRILIRLKKLINYF